MSHDPGSELSFQQLRRLPFSPPPPHLAKAWEAIGQRNPWIRAAWDPPFQAASIRICRSRGELRRWLEHGNWCNGTGFAITERNITLCCIQQGENTDEWLMIKSWPDGTHLDFESVSWHLIISRHGPACFEELLDRMFAASPRQCRELDY